MPYAIRKAEDGYNVIKKDTGEVLSHHDSRRKAIKSIQAAYADERHTENRRHPWFLPRVKKS